MKPIYLEDGSDVTVIVKLEPSVHDPAQLCVAVAQTFRVIANSFGPTLVLVPLASTPVKLASTDMRDGE